MPTLRTLSSIAIVIGASMSFPALAHADDVEDAVVNTTCSAEQITGALQKVSPVAYAYLSGDPARLANAKSQLRGFLAKNPKARRAALEQPAEDGNSSLITTLEQHQDIALPVLSTCDQY